MNVIAAEFDGQYHRSKSGYYAVCGGDFNPHHAERVGREDAERAGYRPCPDCFG